MKTTYIFFIKMVGLAGLENIVFEHTSYYL